MSGNVDAHVHVWSLARGDYGWLTADLAAIHRDFSLSEFDPLRARASISKVILVQAAPTVAETHYRLHVAAKSGGMVRGVVGWVDCAAADAVPTLTRLSRNSLFKAVRPMLQDLADPAWSCAMTSAARLPRCHALGCASRRWSRPLKLPALFRCSSANRISRWWSTTRRAGDCRRHLGTVGRAHRALAAYPRVRCKLSGLVTEAGARWNIDQLRPYVEHLRECFSAQRLIWGSDWPVVNLAATYQAWYAATVALTAEWTQAEGEALMGGSARRFDGGERSPRFKLTCRATFARCRMVVAISSIRDRRRVEHRDALAHHHCIGLRALHSGSCRATRTCSPAGVPRGSRAVARPVSKARIACRETGAAMPAGAGRRNHPASAGSSPHGDAELQREVERRRVLPQRDTPTRITCALSRLRKPARSLVRLREHDVLFIRGEEEPWVPAMWCARPGLVRARGAELRLQRLDENLEQVEREGVGIAADGFAHGLVDHRADHADRPLPLAQCRLS